MDGSSSDDAPGHDFPEKLSEKVAAGLGPPNSWNTPTDRLSIDTHPVPHNGLSTSPGSATPAPNGQAIEEITQSQHFTLRTLPGVSQAAYSLLSLSHINSLVVLIVDTQSMDSICRSRAG